LTRIAPVFAALAVATIYFRFLNALSLKPALNGPHTTDGVFQAGVCNDLAACQTGIVRKNHWTNVQPQQKTATLMGSP